MPLHRRLPKRGFVSRNRVEYAIVNLSRLESAFDADAAIDLETLQGMGLAKKGRDRLKVLGQGDLTKSLKIRAHKFSQSAVDKIAAAGGTVEIVES